MKEFRFAIMGAAKIARKFCEAVKLLDGCTVVAVSSKSLEKAQKFAQDNDVPAYYDSYEQMLIAEKPDCVYIAVTPHDHFRLGMLCLDYDTPVLCEKAMFLSAAEAETFFARAREKNVFAMEAMWSRFLPALNTARGWLRAGRIGDVVMAECGIGFRAPQDPQERYLNPALGGGAAFDITVYGYEITMWMLEREVERLHVEAVPAVTGVDMSEMLLLRFAGDIPAVIKTTFAADFGDAGNLIIYGTKGRIVVPNPHVASEAHLYADTEEHFTDTVTQNGFTYEIAETVRCIRAGLPESPVVPHRDTITFNHVTDQIKLSLNPAAAAQAGPVANCCRADGVSSQLLPPP